MRKVIVRGMYAYPSDEVSIDTGVVFRLPSRAVQSEKDDCDINTIVRRFGVTGQLPTGVRMPTYGDFVGIGDYQEALHALMEAQASFAAMPAEVRRRFNNDPAMFVEFCSDPANLDEARRLGLAVPEVTPPPASPQPAPAEG